MLPSISGVVFYDAAGSGSLNSSDVRLANVTVNLYQGSGTTNLLTSTQTNSAGVYQFTNLQAGTYTVQQTVASGYVLPNGGATQTVTITSSNLTGTTGATIDAFTTAEEASASYSKGTTGNVQVAAPEAIGGYRGLYMQLTSPYGGMDMNTNTDVPNTLTLSTGPGASGDQRVIWDGAGSNAATLNPLGLNHVDLTSGGTATGFDLTLGSDHDNATAVFKIYTDSGDWSTATVSIPNTGDGTANQQIFLPFSSFISGSGSGANSTNVGAITLDVSGPGAFDGEVGDITTAGPKVFATNFADTAQSDLSIVKSASPSQATAGSTQPLTYTLTVTNNGPSADTGVIVSDPLPSGVTYVSSSATQGSVTYAGGTITANLGNMADDATATVTVTATVNPDTRGTITNTATVTGNEPDPNLSNNTSTVQTPVVAQTDLAVVKSVNVTQAIAGSTTPMTYTMTVTNNGPSNATGVTLSDTLPSGVTYVSSSAAQGSVTFANGVITGSLGNLADGGSDKVTVVVTVNASTTGTISNTATVTGNETDPNLANNTSTVQTPVVAQTDLAVVKSVDTTQAIAGSTTPMTYTMLVTNNGPSNATGVTLSDTLPSGVTYVSSSAAQGSVTFANGVITGSLGNLADGGSDKVTVVVTVNASTTGTISNTATVTGNETDTNLEQHVYRANAGRGPSRFGHRQDGLRQHGEARRHLDLHPDGDQQRALQRYRHNHQRSAAGGRHLLLDRRQPGDGERQQRGAHRQPGQPGHRGQRHDHGGGNGRCQDHRRLHQYGYRQWHRHRSEHGQQHLVGNHQRRRADRAPGRSGLRPGDHQDRHARAGGHQWEVDLYHHGHQSWPGHRQRHRDDRSFADGRELDFGPRLGKARPV